MKTLYLLRHAKSSWDNPDLRDFERPLAKRAARDVPLIASRFMDRRKNVGCIISSPAKRAKTTARMFARHIGFPLEGITSNPELYFASVSALLKSASLVDEDFESAMLVGHNPAVTEFANMIANLDIDNIPTCGLVELSLPIDTWMEIEAGLATLIDFDYPKRTLE